MERSTRLSLETAGITLMRRAANWITRAGPER